MKLLIRTSTLFGALCLLCFISCKKDNNVRISQDNDSHNVVLSVSTQSVSSADNTAENRLERLDVYSFVKLPATADYMFEKQFENLPITNSTCAFELVGNLPRQIYYVANNTLDKIDYLKALTASTNSTDFLTNCLFVDISTSQLPLVMSGFTSIESFSTTQRIDAELSYAAARLDVIYRYVGFTPDSLILRNAVPASYLFTETIPLPSVAPRQDIRYTTGDPIYLYQNKDATLTIYGKYDGVRVVFDVALGAVKPSTRYNVTVRSKDDVGVDFASNLIYDIKEWNTGDNVDSQPDWQ